MNLISYEDFLKVELRSGVVVKVEEFPRAKKPAYKVWVDFGAMIGIKQTSAQVTVHYTPDTLMGKNWWWDASTCPLVTLLGLCLSFYL